MLRRNSCKSRAAQLTIFIGSAALGAAGILSGGWMLAKGDLSFTTGFIGSVIPLVIGCIRPAQTLQSCAAQPHARVIPPPARFMGRFEIGCA